MFILVLDKLITVFVLVLASPVLIPVLILVWLQDRESPIYIGQRVAQNGVGTFGMRKVRSMVANADKSGLASTSSQDNRITPIGRFVRRAKIDELGQLFNVLGGEMSLVGPRPQVEHDVNLYTDVEKTLLTVRPGITDLASIVFSDEGDILAPFKDPDLAYNQRIRPWKSRLAMVWVHNQSVSLYFRCLYLTFLAVVNKPRARDGVVATLKKLNADVELIRIAKRDAPLEPSAPPGTTEIFQGRQ